MEKLITYDEIKDKLIHLRGQDVLLDASVAEIYGVQTRLVNIALKNNPEKFPEGYVFELQLSEKQDVIKNFDRFENLKHSTVTPHAFTEKGLYMLATILKSPRAAQATIAIIEAFAKIRELSRTVAEISETQDEQVQKHLIQKGGGIIADLFGGDIHVSGTETEVEVNFAIVKLRHTVRREK